MRNAQVSIAIIFGIMVILGFLFLFSSLSTTHLPPPLSQHGDLVSSRIFIAGCLDRLFEDGLFFVFLNGGYYHPSEPIVPFLFTKVPLDQYMPEMATIEQEVSSFVETNARECIEMKGVSIIGKPHAKVLLGTTSFLTLDHPLSQLGPSTYTLIRSFTAKSRIPVMPMLIVARALKNTLLTHPGSVPVGELTALALISGVTMDQVWFDNQVVVYSLYIPTQSPFPLVWNDAHQYQLRGGTR